MPKCAECKKWRCACDKQDDARMSLEERCKQLPPGTEQKHTYVPTHEPGPDDQQITRAPVTTNPPPQTNAPRFAKD